MTSVPHDGGDPVPAMGPDANVYDCYESITTGDDELVVYALDSEDCWMQSDTYLVLEAMR